MSFLGCLRGAAWAKAHGLAIEVLTGSHSGTGTEQPRGMLRLGWWKEDGGSDHSLGGGIRKRNTMGWDNPAAEPGRSSLTIH